MEITLENTNRRLSKDLSVASMTLTDTEARFLVDTYYQMQDYRIATAGQCRSIEQAPDRYIKDRIAKMAEVQAKESLGDEPYTEEKYQKALKKATDNIKKDETLMAMFVADCPVVEPHETLSFFTNNFANNEADIKKALQQYAMSRPIGRWLMSICGIGPVIAAGLMANINIHKAPTAGHIWNYCGLNPNIKWDKNQKRPFNAKLKCLCWKIGESFVKVQNKDNDVYGHIMQKRIEYENIKNELGDYTELAHDLYEKYKNTNKMVASKPYYKEGKLSPSHIKARAKRYAVKMFLSHMQAVWYEMEYGEKAPKPFAIAILGHAHEIPIPNYEMVAEVNQNSK